MGKCENKQGRKSKGREGGMERGRKIAVEQIVEQVGQSALVCRKLCQKSWGKVLKFRIKSGRKLGAVKWAKHKYIYILNLCSANSLIKVGSKLLLHQVLCCCCCCFFFVVCFCFCFFSKLELLPIEWQLDL